MRLKGFAVLAATAMTLTGCGAGTENDAATQALADRIAIEDMLVEYYGHFGSDKNEDFAKYYTEDAVFDVNGFVSEGRDAIVAMYDGMGQDPAAEAEEHSGVFHMILSNLEVKVDGDTATAKMFYTGVMNSDPFGSPHLQEQGREYDLLVKQDGKWMIKKRVILADSGIPARFKGSYDPRLDYDILKDQQPAVKPTAP